MKKRALVPPSPEEILAQSPKRGAPFGNNNALKHGQYTRARRALNADISAYVRRCRELIDGLPKKRAR